MPPINWGMVGEQAAGGILGIALGAYNDNRQLRQQGRLQQQQIAGQKEMTDYSYKKQLEMWEKTGYGPTKEQMKKAGINPGLLYGMGGAGGQSTGGGVENVTGGQAPQGGREPQDFMGMGIQMQLIDAQRKVLESQANLNNTQAGKIGGVDTQETQANIDLLKQGLDNARWDFELKQLDNTLKHMEIYIKQNTMDDIVKEVKARAEEQIADARSALVRAGVDEATQDEKILLVKQELANKAIEGLLLKENVTLAQGAQVLQSVEARKMFSDMARDWQKLRIDEQEMYIHRYSAKVGAAAIPAYLMTEIVKTVGGILTVGQLITPGKKEMQHIEGFKQKW